MCKYSDNFFFALNNILRGFSLSIYIIYNVSAPPSALPVKILHQNRNFPPFSLRKKKLMRIFATLNNDSNLSRRAAVIAQRRLRGLFLCP